MNDYYSIINARFTHACIVTGITFLRPTAPCRDPSSSTPTPGLINFFTALGPNYLFTAPNEGITFSRSPSIKNYLFTAPSNKSLPCLFYCFRQNSTYSLFETSFNNSHSERLCFIQFSTRMVGWLFLTFLI